jgi:hypothetical protein
LRRRCARRRASSGMTAGCCGCAQSSCESSATLPSRRNVCARRLPQWSDRELSSSARPSPRSSRCYGSSRTGPRTQTCCSAGSSTRGQGPPALTFHRDDHRPVRPDLPEPDNVRWQHARTGGRSGRSIQSSNGPRIELSVTGS